MASDEGKYTAMLALAEGSLPEAEFAAWLRERIRSDDDRVHESKPAY